MVFNDIPERPYPTIGEIYRSLAVALDTKNKNRDVDRLARDGDFDYRLKNLLIDELFRQPLSKKIDPDFADIVCDLIREMIPNYIKLINTVNLDSLTRSQSIPLLVRHDFIYYATALLTKVHRKYKGPNPVEYVTSEKPPVLVAWNWLEQNCLVFKSHVQSQPKDAQDQFRKWKLGKDLPSLKSIVLLLEQMPESGQKQQIKVHLILARSLQYFFLSYPKLELQQTLRVALWEVTSHDIGKKLSIERNKVAEKFDPLADIALKATEALTLEQAKSPSCKDSSRKILNKFDQLSRKLDTQGITRHYLEWLEARWLVFSGEYSKALTQYEKAVAFSIYRTSNLQQIFSEALSLAARQQKRSLLKKLKNQAIAFGFYTSPGKPAPDSKANKHSNNHIVEDWEVEKWFDAFGQIFPYKGCFPGQVDQKDHQLTSPLPIVSNAQFEQRPDLKNPDKRVDQGIVIGGNRRKYPQIIWQTISNQPEHVAQLIEAGADVNQLSDVSDSALLIALNNVVEERDRRCFDILSQQPHNAETMNTPSDKKKRTILLEAVETGEPDIVEKVIQMGTLVKKRGRTDNATALNNCIKYLGSIANPNLAIQKFLELDHNDPVLLDTVRRGAFARRGLTEQDIKKHMEMSRDNPLCQSFERIFIKLHIEKQLERFEYPKLFSIAKLLLEHGADPNAVHTSPINGYTPLMLAVELDLPDLVQLLLDNGGSPYKTFKTKPFPMDCWTIANKWRSAKALQILGRKTL